MGTARNRAGERGADTGSASGRGASSEHEPADTRGEALAETLDIDHVPPVARAAGRAPFAGDVGRTLPPGTMLSESYRVERVLGQGGMGVVYVVEHVDLGRRFAAKVVGREVDAEALARLRKEARVASGIRHPNIVDVVHLGSRDDGTVFVVMELLEGEDLGARLDRQREAHPDSPWLPIAELRAYASQMFAGLAAAHAAGVVHRDLKPDNVFLAEIGGDTVVKLLDFGIAKAVDPQRDHRLTRTGQVIGTPLYMAPEQTRSMAEVDARADLYSMGVILYEMVAGAPPFDAETIYDLIVKHATEPPEPPREHRPDLPERVEEVILRCLRKDRDDRFDRVESLSEAWDAAWDAAPPSCEAPPPPEEEAPERERPDPAEVRGDRGEPPEAVAVAEPGGRPRGGPAIGVAVAAGALLVAGAGAWWWTASAPQVGPIAPSEARAAEPEAHGEPVAGEPPPAEPEAVAEAPETLTRRVTSEPSGAEVSRDGVVLGTTPLDVEIAAGDSAELVVRAEGHEPSTISVDGDGADPLAVELAALPEPRPSGGGGARVVRPRERPSSEQESEPARRPEPPPERPSSGGLLVGMDAFDAEQN